jgi:hypothetical protein
MSARQSMDPWHLFYAVAWIVAEAENLQRDVLLRGKAIVRVVARDELRREYERVHERDTNESPF